MRMNPKRQEELDHAALLGLLVNLSLILGVHRRFGAHMEVHPAEATVQSPLWAAGNIVFALLAPHFSSHPAVFSSLLREGGDKPFLFCQLRSLSRPLLRSAHTPPTLSGLGVSLGAELSLRIGCPRAKIGQARDGGGLGRKPK